ncbi:hypothetical protein RUM44_008635 [Polyplax serrata]|uniref:Mitochondrial inner membrane protease ATP23 n=1 Tax=Polyplax serrata TaxID=468196 RepID=A0ABR1BD10_POLSC
MADSTDSTKKQENQEWYRDFGYDMCPERRRAPKHGFWDVVKERKFFKLNNTVTCERNVVRAIKENPVVKLLIAALKEAGCPVDLRRNFACETCESSVTGGYDQELNQIVVCHNQSKSRSNPDVTLVHELIHMYDHCVGEVNFKNIEHLACSEIRAANIAHCSFLSSFFLAQSSFFNIKKTHQDCVKFKAAQSMMLARDISLEDALSIISKVFDKCYNDLEPVGRRLRRNSLDAQLAYNEAIHLGFCKPLPGDNPDYY